MNRISVCIFSLIIFLSLSSGVFACEEEIRSLEEEIQWIRKDMGEIKRVLVSILPVLVRELAERGNPSDGMVDSRVAGRDVRVSIKNGVVMGEPADVVLVEFSDYECPFCARFYTEVLKPLREEYIDTGKVMFVYKDFPLTSIHRYAMPAAIAARCAGEQGRYLEMHDGIFENQEDISRLRDIAESIGLDMDEFSECIGSGRYRQDVEKDIEEGRRIGIRGTPSFILGRLVGDGVVEGELIQGFVPFDVLRRKIDALLK